MRRTNIYLDDRQTAALEEASRVQGITRAELVRRLLDKGIGSEDSSDLEADLAAIDDSFGLAPTAVDTLPRSRDARARHLARVRRG
jgi:hypothetical protein